MKFSPASITILNNLSQINPGIVFAEGQKQKTVSPADDIFVRVKLPDSITKEFALYNLKEFISTIGLFDDHELKFDEHWVEVKSAKNPKNKIRYNYSNADSVYKPKGNSINLPSVEVEFDITEADFARIYKASSILDLKDLVIVGAEGRTIAFLKDNSRKGSNNFSLDLGTNAGGKFELVFSLDNLKIIPADYHIKICTEQFISEFSAVKSTQIDVKDLELVYNISLQTSSTYSK